MNRNALAALLGMAALAGARELATPSDLWQWRTASDARISSDGVRVIYVEQWNDAAGNRSYANLWLISTDGRERTRFTEGDWRDRSPRWSPDNSRIAWISDRGGSPRIWVGKPGGQPTAIMPAGNTPLALAWSPDGSTIAFTERTETASPPSWAPAALIPMLGIPPARNVDLFLVASSGGTPRRLSGGPLSYEGEPAWAPNGQNVICAERGGELFAIRVLDGAARQLTRTGEIHREPTPSPDGARIAYTAAAAQGYDPVRKLWVMNADGSRARQLAGALDRDARNPAWSNDSRTVYFIADDRGATHVYAARGDGSARQVTNRAERLWSFSLADNGRAVTVRSNPTEGSAVFTFTTDLPAGGWSLIDVNQRLMAEREWGAVEELPFQSAGRTMQAYLVKPPRFDSARKYPLLLRIADRASAMVGHEFQLRAQILAARGMVVLLANPRGAPGYGEEFGDLLPTQIPGDPADDLLRAVDQATGKSYIDAKRVMVSGGLTAVWMMGHTARFSAAVIRRAIVDWSSYPDAARWLRVQPWEDPDLYSKHSPIFFAGNFQTPALVIARSADPQSDELYAALKSRKVDTAIIRPGSTPAGRIAALEAEASWLGR